MLVYEIKYAAEGGLINTGHSRFEERRSLLGCPAGLEGRILGTGGGGKSCWSVKVSSNCFCFPSEVQQYYHL